VVKVLYVTAEVPYPLSTGYLRHFEMLRGLGREHAVTYLSLTRRATLPPQARAALAPHVATMEVFGGGRGGGRVRRAVRLRRAADRLGRAAAAHLAAGDADVVLLSGKDTFPALRAIGDAPLVVDVCDVASLRLRGELAVAPMRRRPALALRLAQMRRIERRLARRPHLLFASERDRDALGAIGGIVVPNGVDIAYWARRLPLAYAPAVAFSGVMAYRPNHDAALRLVTRVLPRVRARVPALDAAARRHDAIVTGACPDLRPHLEAAAVYCAPLRFSSGIQNKLLEALAMELAVVTTSVAAAGLRIGGHEPPLLVADDDDALAAAVARLLDDAAERARLGAAGRRYVERHFSWAGAVTLVDGALRRAADAPGALARDPAPRPMTMSTGPHRR
jgi:polysaccharide biosynthesis protein PslH